MAKWADYVITCVNLTSDGSKISTVGVHADSDTDLGVKQTWHRAQVVTALGNGSTFVTATLNSEKKWTKGATVQSYTTKTGETYIRTDANQTAKDNLGSLPSC